MQNKARRDVKERVDKVRWQTYLTPAVVDRIRRAAYHLNLTTGELVESAVDQLIREEEKKRGKPFGRITRLRAGRPLREKEQ